jgi:hypothetical protein
MWNPVCAADRLPITSTLQFLRFSGCRPARSSRTQAWRSQGSNQTYLITPVVALSKDGAVQ